MSRARIQRAAIAALLLSTVGLSGPVLAVPAFANPAGTGLVISEVYVNGGSSGASYLNKFVELYNPTPSAVSLTGDTLQYRAPKSTVVPSGTQVFTLSGTVAAHGHFLIQLPGNGASSNPGAPLPTPDLSTGGSVNPGAAGGTLYVAASTSGVLPTDGSVIDRIGWGTSNSPEGTAPSGNSVALSYQRDATGTDTDNNAADFHTAAPTPQDAASDTGSGGGTATVTVTNPGTRNATAGAAIAPLTLSASGGTAPYTWTATGLPSGLVLASDGVVSGTPAAAGTSSVTVTATDATGATGSATFSFQVTSAPTIVPIASIQGTNTDTSPYVNQTVTTEGVVTAAFPSGGFNGFFLETGGTEADDATPGASDAVFVYGSVAAGQVAVGESVRVTGKVQEHQGETEIDSPTVTKLDNPLPPVVPDEIPWSDLATSAQKEAHEGELIAPQGEFTVSDNYDANYYGSFTLAAGNTPLRQPTDAGRAGSAEARAAAADNAARTITLDDGSSWNYSTSTYAGKPLPWLTPDNPVRVGSKVTFHQAVVLDYRYSSWNFQPTRQVTDDGSAVATFSDTRTGNEKPATVGGTSLATFNVENYFPLTGQAYVAKGLGTCTYYNDRAGTHITVNTCTGTDGSPGPRGAADDASFARQQAKIVTGINRLGAGIVSLEEIENSAKFGEPRDTALAGLVDALNAAAGSKVWAYVPSPSADKLPSLDEQDVIRTAFIYKPAQVALVGPATVLTGDSDPGQPFSIAREPLAQGFKKAGTSDADAFLVVANHWKSKGSGTPLYDGDTEDTSSPAVDQGAFNATRVHEAQDVNAFATRVATSLGTSRIFLVGDFNAYTHEDPMEVLYADGYTDLGSAVDPAESTYSYNGLEGSLDHVLANGAAHAMVTGADVWQINAQEAVAYAYSRFNYNATLLFNGGDPFAESDHDPVVVGLTLPATPAWNASTIYNSGDTVAYQGSVWRALWWNQHQAPGSPYGAWEQIVTAPDGTAIWTPSRIFTTGDVVVYQGKKYAAQWWTRNQAPGQPYGPWRSAG
ncbi:ExeM/NucH family extracellular endonuclease [Planosporangium thailandense]|uniref:ExeM/NucH family extracellular endonuclease n=1 Tax=Planosporangium thailandense TaxID=765197 RepID=A0ABX0Y683_9ACTN|nr:ExeM/NucH family extracellular endonuclease [Planosporangium thailandense]NJC73911.1 ExeM/NucH family extracellular endonuclease [Planosporangium thailandense]